MVFLKREVVERKVLCAEAKQLERMFEVAEQEFGELDIVCPGAGIFEPV